MILYMYMGKIFVLSGKIRIGVLGTCVCLVFAENVPRMCFTPGFGLRFILGAGMCDMPLILVRFGVVFHVEH